MKYIIILLCCLAGCASMKSDFKDPIEVCILEYRHQHASPNPSIHKFCHWEERPVCAPTK